MIRKREDMKVDDTVARFFTILLRPFTESMVAKGQSFGLISVTKDPLTLAKLKDIRPSALRNTTDGPTAQKWPQINMNKIESNQTLFLQLR